MTNNGNVRTFRLTPAVTPEHAGGSLTAPPRIGRVAIVFWEGHLSIAPSIVSAMQLLAAGGYEVDVLVRGADEELPPLGSMPPAVRIRKAEFAGRVSSETARKTSKGRLGTTIGSLSFFWFVLRETRNRRYDAIFGVDAVGSACAECVAALKKVPFFYWSLELTFARDARHPFKRLLKWLEKRAARRAAWIVIQDRLREQAFLAEHRPGHTRTLLVPNAPAGASASARSDVPGRPNHLQRTLGIAPDKLIVLHAGMLDPEVLAWELADSVRHWSAPYHLVLHTNFWKPLDDPYIQRIVALREPRLSISNQPVPIDQLDALIASAHIGLATYRDDLGPNYSLIVNASGKIPYYLRNGIPVICSDLPGMRDLMEQYGCGVAVRNVSEIPAALDAISRDYASFRRGALACYQERYEFSAHFAAVLEALALSAPTREKERRGAEQPAAC